MFPPGEDQISIPIEIVNDDVFEGDQQFSLRLRAIETDGVTMLTLNEAIVRIIDDDGE